MFNNATAFNNGGNSSIGSWNTSNVIQTGLMFQNATAFNQNISTWNASNFSGVTNMFAGATSFDQNLSPWVMAMTTQPAGFSTGANATWIANRNTRFPFIAGGVTRVNT
jgi:hypothetical protein